jgi:RNA polymerase sigma-70 factor (ECF subfamily)
MYGSFIVNAALDCGLSEADAEDVLQETVIEVTKRIHEFRYDPKRCRFKTWLMRITRSKVVDRIRREDPAEPLDDEAENQFETNFAVEWEEDWRSNIAAEALRLVRQRSRPKVFQMFQLSTVEGKDPVAVARFLGVTRLAVYMARYKVLREIRREVQKLEKGDF